MMRFVLFMLALASASPAAAQGTVYPRDLGAGPAVTWPRDPGSGQPVVVQPVSHPALTALITVNDDPAPAFRANEEGNVGLRLTVSAKGKVSNCAVRQSSGSQVLDGATCILLTRRARFEPALDAAGQPTEAKIDHLVIWKITDEIRRARH